jgi:hypothetical protein
VHYYWLILGTLAVWRVTHLLYAEDGPRDIFVKFRRYVGEGFWGGLFDCFYCLSLLISLPLGVWIGESGMERALLWPALSAGAILLERMTAHDPVLTPAAPYLEGEEEKDVLFRKASDDALERRL